MYAYESSYNTNRIIELNEEGGGKKRMKMINRGTCLHDTSHNKICSLDV